MNGNFRTLNAKPVRFHGVEYPSVIAFARAFGIHASAVSKRLKDGITDERLAMRRISRKR